ncbi:hypothetical protein L6164_025258 [Bauhinia variegata]|uniref:Uncharacterized protein n=1 Tax=Bauhinia variegata TaxID=167791 RepID=A0ACB9M2K7_BAUVA|nr:hypothetical protein L6164_025258 [Bauhinia variegata]
MSHDLSLFRRLDGSYTSKVKLGNGNLIERKGNGRVTTDTGSGSRNSMDNLSKNQIFAAHGIVAAGSVALGTAFTYPLDTIKVLAQVGSSSGKKLTAARVLQRVRLISRNRECRTFSKT